MRAGALISGKSFRWLQQSVFAAVLLGSLAAIAETPQTPAELINLMTARECQAADHHNLYAYLSNERSERTGGHLWIERVVEVPQGHIRYLVAEDGSPLPPARLAAERAKLAEIIAKPNEFARRELASKNDELRARAMLDRLSRGFIVENIRLEGSVWTLDYRPEPGYSPNGMEDRVLHNMSGTFSIDAHDYRLIHLDGHMSEDVTFGLGLLATLRAGSNFSLDKTDVQGSWRAVHVTAEFHGKALFFKTIARSTLFTRSDFQRLDSPLTLTQAVTLAESWSANDVSAKISLP